MDGRFSLVKHRFRWLLYGRANHLSAGGRSVQVARSRSKSPLGPYGPYQQLSWEGFDLLRPLAKNIYTGAVRNHPTAKGVLVGFFPVNLGQRGKTNGDGTGVISLALSCDGVRWSTLTPLLQSPGATGRTWDHPVFGHVLFNGTYHFYVHHDVPGISPRATVDGHVRAYSLVRGALERLTAHAMATLRGCTPVLSGRLRVDGSDAVETKASNRGPAALGARVLTVEHTELAAPTELVDSLSCAACRAVRCAPSYLFTDRSKMEFPSCNCARRRSC
ncbi:hypothetical protein T492DRAFT_199010 [Pavlovales sp. CCMP2436]|nr:hypothetical protein T492DRAFT_199010 [Pavlovales sp. CCMP2436]|mmetsp:Transcript_12463/g.31556  ORF Transcript_12463/g.31556 Transcript_12463/m.31556 type:complete len:275 (-) Transcript_12463:84-908(-)